MNDTAAYRKSSFGPAFFFLSERQRRALADYYAFCRLADDIVDEPTAHPAQDLKELKQEVQLIFTGTPQTELGKHLQQDVRAFHIPQDRFTLLLEGMEADLQRRQYIPIDKSKPFKELDWYIYRVAVIVGKATLDILGLTGLQAEELAQSLGTAVQLTNIVRDVYEDAQLGRVYIPCRLSAAEILQLYPQAIAENNLKGELFKQALRQCIARAEENYQQAFRLLDGVKTAVGLPCRVMGYIYQKNLAKIKRAGFAFQKPVKLNRFEKIQAVLYAMVKTFF